VNSDRLPVKQPGHYSLRLLQAQWILGEARADLVPGICGDLLVDGYDTESLRVLASLTGAETERVADLLPRLFHEMDMGQPTGVQAAWCVAQSIARDIISGTVTPADGAWEIGHFGTTFDPLFPSLSIFIGLWSEWNDDVERRQQYESDIREEALRLLATGPPSEPGTGSEIDRLVQLAKQQTLAGRPNMPAAAERLIRKIPAGHILSENRGERWIAIGSHNDRQVLVLHTTLPFGFIRPEYRRYVDSVADELGIQLADIASADTRQLSVTPETLATLASGEIVRPGPIDWLSADQVRELTNR